MVTRRTVLKGFGGLVASGFGLTGYAFGIEPFRLLTTRYRLTPPGWPAGLGLRVAALADLHACGPWMTAEHVRAIVAATNALAPDIVVLLGDYTTRSRYVAHPVPREVWAGALGQLKAPLGVHAVLGNHDFWDDPELQLTRQGKTRAGMALEAAGIPVYQNQAVRLAWQGRHFWLGGLGDQWAFRPPRGQRRQAGQFRSYQGVDDLPALLRAVTDDAPLILLAHEPDIFPLVPARVSLTLSGHTHGGQVNILGYMPVIPSRYGNRYAYGHIVEENRHLIVSAGLGCSTFPVRFGRPPEVVLVELGGRAGA